MDSLLTMRRPIKNVKPPSKLKCRRCKRLPPLARRARPVAEAVPETPAAAEETPDPPGLAEHVSFVSLYHDVCRDEVLPATAFLTSGWAVRAGAGDGARAHLVMEIDY